MENPEILWAQSKEILFITLKIPNLLNPEIKIGLDNFIVKGKTEEKTYNLKMDLFKNIIIDESSWNLNSKHLEFKLRKNGNFFWNKLLSNKYSNLKIDWDKWQEEDSDEEIVENRKQMLNNFTQFTKTLPTELMTKDFSELFPSNLPDILEDNESINNQENSEEAVVDMSNIDSNLMSKMEEGLISKKDRESLTSPDICKPDTENN